MYRLPTRPDELARPSGCVLDAERNSNAAEFTAPHETITSGAETVSVLPARSISTASIVLPLGSVMSLRAVALIHSVTFGVCVAGRTPQTSASLFACILQGNELHVLQKMQFSRTPRGSG